VTVERVDAQCRKCNLVFTTAAQTRTTCPGCKAAVTVRRGMPDDGYGNQSAVGGGGSGAIGLAVGVVVAIVLALLGSRNGSE
jgi:hypothetical protein